MRRTPLKRGSKLRAIGKRGRADREAIDAVRQAVLYRDDYTCQRCKSEMCLPLDLHHRKARSQGGEHTEANTVCLGRICHMAITDHTAPDWREWVVTRKAAK